MCILTLVDVCIRVLRRSTAVKRMKFHFKFRVLELIEVFIKRQPAHPLVLSLIEPLLRAYFAVGKEKKQRPLADKLSALLRNRLCKAHEYPDVSVAPKFANDMLEKYFQVAWKNSSKDYRNISTQVVHYLMRVLYASQDDNDVGVAV
jgi:DNA polymerase phi